MLTLHIVINYPAFDIHAAHVSIHGIGTKPYITIDSMHKEYFHSQWADEIVICPVRNTETLYIARIRIFGWLSFVNKPSGNENVRIYKIWMHHIMYKRLELHKLQNMILIIFSDIYFVPQVPVKNKPNRFIMHHIWESTLKATQTVSVIYH